MLLGILRGVVVVGKRIHAAPHHMKNIHGKIFSNSSTYTARERLFSTDTFKLYTHSGRVFLFIRHPNAIPEYFISNNRSQHHKPFIIMPLCVCVCVAIAIEVISVRLNIINEQI